eukprot:PhF_6_TR22225/c0_g1_i1/m.31387
MSSVEDEEEKAREIYAHVFEARTTVEEASKDLEVFQSQVDSKTEENSQLFARFQELNTELGKLTSKLQDEERKKREHVCDVSAETKEKHTECEVEFIRLKYTAEERRQYVQSLRQRNLALKNQLEHMESPLFQKLSDVIYQQNKELVLLRARSDEHDMLIREYDENVSVLASLRDMFRERNLLRPPVPMQRRCDYEVRVKERTAREVGLEVDGASTLPTVTKDITIPKGHLRSLVGKKGDGLLVLAKNFNVNDIAVMSLTKENVVLQVKGPMDAAAAVLNHISELVDQHRKQEEVREGIITYSTTTNAEMVDTLATKLHELLLKGSSSLSNGIEPVAIDDDLPPAPM